MMVATKRKNKAKTIYHRPLKLVLMPLRPPKIRVKKLKEKRKASKRKQDATVHVKIAKIAVVVTAIAVSKNSKRKQGATAHVGNAKIAAAVSVIAASKKTKQFLKPKSKSKSRLTMERIQLKHLKYLMSPKIEYQ